MNPANPLFKLSALSLITLTLVACGGGGSSADSTGNAGGAITPIAPTTPVTPTVPANPAVPVTPAPILANAQGFWSAAPSANTSIGAVILPSGQAWVIYQTGSTVTALAQGALSVKGSTYTGVGKHYSLPGGAVQDFSLSAIPGITGAASTPTLVNTTTVGTGTSTTLTWTYNKAYETAATAASVQGRWSGLQGPVSLIWDIDSAGKLAGTSTTGCTYSGTIAPNANPIAVLDATIAENCAGNLKTLAGIATLNTAKTTMSLAYTTASGAQGGVLVLQK